MTKSTFLKKLSELLSSLSEKEREEILKKYENIIDEEIKNGKKQKEVIQDLGDINLIAKLYVKETKEVNNNEISNYIGKLINYINSFINKIDEKNTKLILEIIIFVGIGFFALALIGIPFQIIYAVLSAIFYYGIKSHFVYHFINSFIILTVLGFYLFAIIWFGLDYIKKVIKYLKTKYEI